ncbi:MAG TPA: VWA domain-containing protein [Vicinamibacterales bacterium]|nr:VWA domain-containing protein [Vicinamibacterales bacterium]HPW19286.1 VWA domain-containing protein [Vicinamibacterales bacterium]
MSRTRRFLAAAAAATLAAAAAGRGPEAAGAAAPRPEARQGGVFRSGARMVPIYATVTDARGALVPDLTRAEFEVLDNGVRQDLLVFENQTQPFTAVVMLDSSGSMTSSLKLVKAAAEQFLIRLLPQDKAQVGAFNDKIQFSGEFTSDRDALIAALGDLDFGNPTRLYDALDESLDRLAPTEGRRVIVVLTDGEDTASRRGRGDVLARAVAGEVMIYGIGLESDYFNGVRRVRTSPDRVVRRLAEETGGGYFLLRETSNLSSTFTRIAQELHSQYVLGFTPAVLDGRVHQLTVNVKRPGMKARARKTYVAASEAGTGPPK